MYNVAKSGYIGGIFVGCSDVASRHAGILKLFLMDNGKKQIIINNHYAPIN